MALEHKFLLNTCDFKEKIKKYNMSTWAWW